jgi:DNA-damage-inducible protein D
MTDNAFEQVKRINEYYSEYWSARELMPLLGYKEWRKFDGVIRKSKEACKRSGNLIRDHFVGAAKMIEIATATVKQTERKINDYHLSRYACYLVAQNGDPRKKEIALAQTYFAVQTRKQEMAEQFLEDEKRVFLREEMRIRNRKLAKAADEAGVVRYGLFQDYGYMGLYGGFGQKEIHARKKLKKSQKILDHMGGDKSLLSGKF